MENLSKSCQSKKLFQGLEKFCNPEILCENSLNCHKVSLLLFIYSEHQNVVPLVISKFIIPFSSYLFSLCCHNRKLTCKMLGRRSREVFNMAQGNWWNSPKNWFPRKSRRSQSGQATTSHATTEKCWTVESPFIFFFSHTSPLGRPCLIQITSFSVWFSPAFV